MGKFWRFALLLVAPAIPAAAQEYAGVWTGKAANDDARLQVMQGITYEYNLTIAPGDSLVNGTVLMELGALAGGKGLRRSYAVSGRWNSQKNQLTLFVEGMYEMHTGRRQEMISGSGTVYRMKLKKRRGEMVLEGRQDDSAKIAIFPQSLRLTRGSSPPAVTAAAGDHRNRITEVQKVIELDSAAVTVLLYDDGVVDQDTVSLYLNGTPVALNQGLSAQPVRLDLQLNAQAAEHELRMVAENLGSIPPNTGLMIVQSNGRRYEIPLSAGLQTNAAVIFRLKKKAG